VRVLHVEDEKLDVFVIGHALEEAGFADVVVASTPAAFERAVADDRFDVVLCDNRVVTMSGLQALSYVRERRPDLPFIVLSGDDAQREILVRAGATAYFTKDDLPNLIALLRRLSAGGTA
jgi:CheY-like chemotaxis protein